MSWGIIAGAAIGLGGTLLASNSASNASREATNASSQANAANIALAQEQRARNEALFAQYLGDENMARAYLDALEYGSGSYTPGATGISGTSGGLDRFSLENYLREQNPAQAAEWDSWERAGNSATNGHRTLWGDFVGYMQAQHRDAVTAAMTEMQSQQETENPNAQTITRDQVMAMLEGTPLAQYANEDYLARGGLNDEYLSGANDLSEEEYNSITGQAQSNLDQRLALEDDSYAAWLPMSQQAERDAVNLNFSRGGVNGLIGDTRRGVGETTQNAAMERNLRYQTGRQAAYSPYYDEMLDATALRGGRRQSAYDTYSGRRAADYDQYAGDRTTAYDSFTNDLRDRQNRGMSARNSIAGFNDNYAAAATASNNSNANSQAQAAYNRGQINQTLYGDLARIAGDAWGSIRNTKKTDTGSGSSSSSNGSSSVYGRGR